MGKIKAEVVIDKIAQVLLVNSSFNNSPGLLFGKAGALLFLYNYDLFKPNDVYFNYANELTIEVSKQLFNTSKHYYSDGICGIGWGLRYLIANEFIADSPIFNDLDRTLLNSVEVPSKLNPEFTGVCNYLHNGYKIEKSEFGSLQEEFSALMKKEFLSSFIDLVLHEWTVIKVRISEVGKIKDLYTLIHEINQFESFYTAVILLTKLEDNAYATALDNLLEELILVFSMIVKHIHRLIQSSSKNHKIEVDFADLIGVGFYQFYNSYIHLHKRSLYLDLSGPFADIAKYIENLHDQIPDLTLNSIAAFNLLRTVSTFHHSADIQQLSLKSRSRIVSYLSDDSRFSNMLGLKNKDLNIGIAGIAGIGLCLLENVEITNWNQGLLIS